MNDQFMLMKSELIPQDRAKAVLLLWILFCYLCFAFVFFILSCLFLAGFTVGKRAGLLALLCVTFPCVFVTLPYGVLGQAWYLIVSITDLCMLLYFKACNHFVCSSHRPDQIIQSLSISYMFYSEYRDHTCFFMHFLVPKKLFEHLAVKLSVSNITLQMFMQ